MIVFFGLLAITMIVNIMLLKYSSTEGRRENW